MKRAICLFLIFMLLVPHIAYASETRDVEIKLETLDAHFSVTLPLTLPVHIMEDGMVVTALETKIINNSVGPIYVKSIELNTKYEDWQFSSYDLYLGEPNKLAFHLNGDYITGDGGHVNLSKGAWNAIKKDSFLPINYSIKVPIGTDDDNLVGIVITVDWYSENSEERPYTYFDVNGGYLPNPPVLVEGQLATKPIDPEMSGYIFEGWYKDESLIVPWDFNSDIVTEDTIIYAKWKVNPQSILTYGLVAFMNEAQVLLKKRISLGNIIPQSEIPNYVDENGKVVYVWYKDAQLTEVWNFATDKVNSNMFLYAKWETPQGKVMFESNGGSYVPDRTAISGTFISKPPDPIVASGGIFDKWYKDIDRTIPWDFENDLMPEGNLTLYADYYLDEGAWLYNIEDGKAVLTKFNKNSPDIFVPNKNKDGLPVELGISKTNSGPFYSNRTSTVSVYFSDKVSVQDGDASYLFRNSTILTSVYGKLPVAEKYISAFEGCVKLINIVPLSEGIIDINSMFSNCQVLTKVPTIASTVEDMTGAFKNCKELLEPPSIPIGVTTIEEAFLNCDKLKSMPIIPDTVINMRGTFEQCSSLRNITNISKNAQNLSRTFYGCIFLETKMEIPEGAVNISNMYYNCNRLNALPTRVPSSVNNMSSAFSFCDKASGNMLIECNITMSEYYKSAFLNAGSSTGITLNWKYPASEEFIDNLKSTGGNGVKKGIEIQ